MTAIEAIQYTAAAIYEAIQGAGDKGIPSGHIYAVLQGKVDLDTYSLIIRCLERAGKITNENHLLKAVTK